MVYLKISRYDSCVTEGLRSAAGMSLEVFNEMRDIFKIK
jgi:hypothetical protein